MDSEVVQRLQKQLLDLRAENCDVKEKNKFIESKLKSIQSEKDEFEKELKLLNRKNKGTLAFSFLPGQSSRDEIIKLQDEIEHLNQALEKQELDFQRHDQALRDEIGLLQRQLQMAQKETKIAKSSSRSSVTATTIPHPLDQSSDSGLDVVEELESKIREQRAQLDESGGAIKQLETMVKQLRLEKEDLLEKLSATKDTEKELKDLREKAQSRKETSDQLAKEVSQLKAKLLETETEARRAALSSQEQLEQSRLKQEDTLKQQVTHANEATKQAELKVIDANRRIDQLMSDKQELEKAYRSQKQTREFIERALDELKEEKMTAQSELESAKSKAELEKVKAESDRAEYESNLAVMRDDMEKLKSNHDLYILKRDEDAQQLKDSCNARVEEEIEKQRIVERKAAVTVRELKKQLQSEKKRADRLADKLKTVDTAQIETGERLQVVGPGRDETSSIGSWSMPTDFDGVTILTGNEAEAIMMKNKQLQEANFQLEEQMRALQNNQIQMSEELANREEILRMRVWNTRPDAKKTAKSTNPISDMILNKINEYTTDHTVEHNPTQLKQLNKKLLRMLEEEMTKNVALRKNIEELARR